MPTLLTAGTCPDPCRSAEPAALVNSMKQRQLQLQCMSTHVLARNIVGQYRCHGLGNSAHLAALGHSSRAGVRLRLGACCVTLAVDRLQYTWLEAGSKHCTVTCHCPHDPSQSSRPRGTVQARIGTSRPLGVELLLVNMITIAHLRTSKGGGCMHMCNTRQAIGI